MFGEWFLEIYCFLNLILMKTMTMFIITCRHMSCILHGKYVFNLLQNFIVRLKSRLSYDDNFIPDLDHLGKVFLVFIIFTYFVYIFIVINQRIIAKRHACLIRCGFSGELFETFGEHLVDMLVMTDFVRVCCFMQISVANLHIFAYEQKCLYHKRITSMFHDKTTYHNTTFPTDMSSGSSRMDAGVRVSHRRDTR